MDSNISQSTLAIHADDILNGPNNTDVAPPLHVSSTYRYTNDLTKLQPAQEQTDILVTNSDHVYSRLAHPNSSRFERILTAVIGAPSLAYASGLAAFFALLIHVRPRVIAISGGYHGCHGVVGIHQKLYGLKVVPLDDPNAWDNEGFGAGDLVHIETPLNPTGEAVDVCKYVKYAEERGALVSVDATFGPPPLQDPWTWGVNFVMHSGTKYFGGHSDMLCGIIAVKDEKRFESLFTDRIFLGSIIGNMEGWLGIRSIRTLELRVERQSQNTQLLVEWIWTALQNDEPTEEDVVIKKVLSKVYHAWVQVREDAQGNEWVIKQMPGGYGPVFSIQATSAIIAKSLPSKLQYFHHATSLGGIESLIEWRAMSDSAVDNRILRLSIGIEAVEDLRSDLLKAFRLLA